jgi:hypothetical protein
MEGKPGIGEKIRGPLRIHWRKGPRIQVKGVEVKTLEPSNPGILEPYFRIKPKITVDLKEMKKTEKAEENKARAEAAHKKAMAD